ncbi:hypothetical protein [Sphingomonas sp. R86521]|uniref:hypothetical protein n=1 Tax=Sphingomonas sp. R86521 TaxID=3093860 RepID=UPI0036D2840D
MSGISNTATRQPSLFPSGLDGDDALGLTFRDSKSLPVHGWYPYVEGFAAGYIEDLVRSHVGDGIVYDPFGGSGTVNLIASQLGRESAFSEANPFMRFVAETKVNARATAKRDFAAFSKCVARFRRWVMSKEFESAASRQNLDAYDAAFSGRDFFQEDDLRELITIRDGVEFHSGGNRAFKDLLLLAVMSVTVACSNMTRRADLRRRRPDEYLTRVVDVRKAVLAKLVDIERDIQTDGTVHAPTAFVSNDAREYVPALHNRASLILTSPPYLNGTSYIRNTKLELWLAGFIENERELSSLNKICMVCGISNVVKGRPPTFQYPSVESVAGDLDRVSPDQRIPALVRGYFSDMFEIFKNCASYLTEQGSFVLDIGDSKFYGIHVPTDELLIEVAASAGFAVKENRILARRHSRDKSPLKQVELTFIHAH